MVLPLPSACWAAEIKLAIRVCFDGITISIYGDDKSDVQQSFFSYAMGRHMMGSQRRSKQLRGLEGDLDRSKREDRERERERSAGIDSAARHVGSSAHHHGRHPAS